MANNWLKSCWDTSETVYIPTNECWKPSEDNTHIGYKNTFNKGDFIACNVTTDNPFFGIIEDIKYNTNFKDDCMDVVTVNVLYDIHGNNQQMQLKVFIDSIEEAGKVINKHISICKQQIDNLNEIKDKYM